ncbi:MAG: DUF2480 family protein [Rhodothermia bacterium]|nr:DUF2480 family protein [Rhodothermia bacterium]
MEPIKNKVAESDIEVFNLEDLWDGKSIREIDLADFLVEGLVLREKEFRSAVKETDWSQYRDAHVAVGCSTDAIVPTWAYMLIGSKLASHAESVTPGSSPDVIRDHFVRRLESFDWEKYRDGIVVVKGCASDVVPVVAYVIAAEKLKRVARKVMYGEPCSSVPIWRRPATESGAGARPAQPAKAVSAKLPSGSS